MNNTLRSVAVLATLLTLGRLLTAAPEPPAKPAPTGIEGIWEGPLKVGPIELRLALRITKADDGKLAAKLDSIDQGARDISCPEVEFAERKLTVGIPLIKARYAGTLADDGQSVKGSWDQAGQAFPLELKRVEKVSTPNRPQHPKPPFPYRVEEVTFTNPAAGGITLAGTLTLPRGDGPFPAVALITGSGAQDRDETIFGHKPFLVLADHLTRRGVAVLRYDDRGVGKSGGKATGATSADFATDAHAAVAFLRGRPEIDPKRVGLAGHSEGGIIAPMVAADHPGDVAFLVLLAGTGLPGNEVMARQLEDIARTGGDSAAKVALLVRFQKALVAAAAKGRTAEERKESVLAAAKAFEAVLTDDEKKLVHPDESGEKVAKASADRLTDPWMHYFLNHDPRPALRKVTCPVLAVNGENDLQVAHGPNLAAIAAALKEGGNARVTVKMFPGLNHLFQHSKTGRIAEYGQIEETFAPEALTFLGDWLTGLK
jgi:pimeloyl-ACP methyl ester carboxylesterase